MNKVLHRSETRGRADHGWLQSRHTFSFADYHDPERVHFGRLRVVNDDVVAPARGFGTHPHRDMEIVSVPLSGTLRHRDSMGNVHVIRAGEVQVMSAGSGVTHSEYNDSDSEPVNFLQIWVMPKLRGSAPRYGQRAFDPAQRRNRLQFVVAPDGAGDALSLNQDAWFALADIDAGAALSYPLHGSGNGVYLFVIEGEVDAAGERLSKRDGMGVSGVDAVDIASVTASTVLVMEVPMK